VLADIKIITGLRVVEGMGWGGMSDGRRFFTDADPRSPGHAVAAAADPAVTREG
jgi:hypothetical protein